MRYLTVLLSMLTVLSFSVPVCAEVAPVGADTVLKNPAPASDNPLLGVWSNKVDPTAVLYFQPGKVFWLKNGELEMALAKYEPGKVLIWIYGRKQATWTISVDKDTMELAYAAKKSATWLRKKDIPKELVLSVEKLGEAKAIHPEQAKIVQTQIKERLEKYNTFIAKDEAAVLEKDKFVVETRRFLKEIIAEFGWFDSIRFGTEIPSLALDLLQKCGDIPLAVAVLESVEKEGLAKRLNGNDAARFFDRIKLVIGERQRYGTQLGQNEKKEIFVLPVESREKLDDFRKTIGLEPLAKDKNFKFDENW